MFAYPGSESGCCIESAKSASTTAALVRHDKVDFECKQTRAGIDSKLYTIASKYQKV
jgi:hypothetical protein